MSPTIETTQTQEAPDCNGAMADYIEKMMGLELSKLQKIAKKKGIAKEAIQGAATGAENEEDAKEVLIQMLLKAQSMKLVPSPTRARKPVLSLEEEMKAQTCLVCPGCIRPPKHDGNCMDGQCNDIFLPESPKKESGIDGAAEAARHKEIKWEQQRKMEEMNRLEDEAQERKEARCKEEARRKAAQAAEEEARSKEEARLKAAQEAAAARAQKKVEEEEARRKAEQAARQKALAEGVARRKAADEEARRKAVEADEEQALRLVKEAEQEEAQRVRAAEEEAQRRAAEEEAKEAELWRAAVEVAEKEARDKAVQEEKAAEVEEAAREAARARRRAAEEVAMAEMDERCVETFLNCMNCAWRERIRTPLKGSNLYTKHIRPCRPAGTSVDVKDSGFRSLGNFLQFLEDEGLLRLKPGLSDPVVTEIRLDACRKYKYVARPQSSPTKEATQEEYFTPLSTPSKEISLRPQSTPCSASRMLSFQ